MKVLIKRISADTQEIKKLKAKLAKTQRELLKLKKQLKAISSMEGDGE